MVISMQASLHVLQFLAPVCRFERGDLVYDRLEVYQKWEDAVKNIHYSIQVNLPAQGVGRATLQAGVFEENWKSEVVFTLTDYKANDRRKVTTTQGRLYTLLWKDNWDIATVGKHHEPRA